MKKINKWIKYKNFLADRYIKAFKGLPIRYQKIDKKKMLSAYHLFIILVDRKNFRDKVFNKLLKSGIALIFIINLFISIFYKKFFSKKNDFNSSEEYYKKCISIPLYSDLKIRQQDFVIDKIKSLLK